MGRFAWVAARVAREGNEADTGQVVRRRHATRMDLGVPIPWAEATRLPADGRSATGKNRPGASRAKIESPARGNYEGWRMKDERANPVGFRVFRVFRGLISRSFSIVIFCGKYSRQRRGADRDREILESPHVVSYS